ncbi:MAG: PIN domain-containing protein [Solirubrobacteraceae bacterium]
MKGILDTSVFITSEQGCQLDRSRLPDEAAISIVTLAELALGVHMATSEAVRARRLRTLQAAQSTYAALDVDEAVAASFAELVATARKAGRRPKVQDAWIAATAHAHRVAVYSQDADFDDLAISVVRV